MLYLIGGIVIFIAVHCLPMMVETRTRLIDRVGMVAYQVGFAFVSLLGLGLMIWGRGAMEFIEIWQPFGWSRYATIMLMFPAILLGISAFGPENSFRRILGHPMILGVELWAIAHLLANGDLASILFFGAFFLWALTAFTSAIRRKPPVGSRGKLLNDTLFVVVALVVYVGAFRSHEWFPGVSLIN